VREWLEHLIGLEYLRFLVVKTPNFKVKLSAHTQKYFLTSDLLNMYNILSVDSKSSVDVVVHVKSNKDYVAFC